MLDRATKKQNEAFPASGGKMVGPTLPLASAGVALRLQCDFAASKVNLESVLQMRTLADGHLISAAQHKSIVDCILMTSRVSRQLPASLRACLPRSEEGIDKQIGVWHLGPRQGRRVRIHGHWAGAHRVTEARIDAVVDGHSSECLGPLKLEASSRD